MCSHVPLFSVTMKTTSFTVSFTCESNTYSLTQLLGLLQTLAHHAHFALETERQNEIRPEMKEFARVGFLSTAPEPSAHSTGRSASVSLGGSYSDLLYNSYLRN